MILGIIHLIQSCQGLVNPLRSSFVLSFNGSQSPPASASVSALLCMLENFIHSFIHSFLSSSQSHLYLYSIPFVLAALFLFTVSSHHQAVELSHSFSNEAIVSHPALDHSDFYLDPKLAATSLCLCLRLSPFLTISCFHTTLSHLISSHFIITPFDFVSMFLLSALSITTDSLGNHFRLQLI